MVSISQFPNSVCFITVLIYVNGMGFNECLSVVHLILPIYKLNIL